MLYRRLSERSAITILEVADDWHELVALCHILPTVSTVGSESVQAYFIVRSSKNCHGAVWLSYSSFPRMEEPCDTDRIRSMDGEVTT